MEVDLERIQELIQQPQESLSVELKAWIDPGQPEGIAKIVKTCLALRNHGGGYMVIGIDNDTLEPLLDSAPSNARQIFHIDKIQGMVAKYSSDPFEVTVEFPREHLKVVKTVKSLVDH
jgi:predicted HTH transcriptional regulator